MMGLSIAITEADTRAAAVMMVAGEARQVTDKIKVNLRETRILLLEIYERKGWKALGYASWREYGQAEFGHGESHLYRLMDAARVQRNLLSLSALSPIGENDNGRHVIPEGQLRPLASLEPTQQIEAWQRAIDTAPDGKLTAAHVQEVVQQITRPHVAQSSGNNEWYTPPEYIRAAWQAMGSIDLDPATSEIANRTVGAATFYTAEDGGLSKEWSGRVWMNPPYATPLIGQFADKLALHVKADDVIEACVLVNNATETGWFNTMLDLASCVCFIRKRVRFLDAAGNPSGAPLQGQVVLYIGPNIVRFAKAFSGFGAVLYARPD